MKTNAQGHPVAEPVAPLGNSRGPLYVLNYCNNPECQEPILREATWSTARGRVLPIAGRPWIHALSGREVCGRVD